MNERIVAGVLLAAIAMAATGVAIEWSAPIALMVAGPLVAVWALFAIREFPEATVAATDEP